MKKVRCLFILLSFFSFYSNAQNFIIAGQHTGLDYYHDFVPDSSILYSCDDCTINFPIDINHDDTTDFMFSICLSLGPMGMQHPAFCYIIAKNSNKIAAGADNSCTPGSKMAQSFNINDTIKKTSDWDSLAYLYNVDSPCNSSFSSHAGDSGYVALQVNSGTLSYLGWIKIVEIYCDCTWGASSFVKLGSFACQKNFQNIVQYTASSLLNIFPNPATGTVHITNSDNDKIREIILYDVCGKEVMHTQEKNIDVSKLQEGVYFVRIETSNGIFNKKIIIEK